MRILMTGATGFIGGALARELLARGHELVCAVRDPARLALAGPRCRALQADLASVPSAQWWRAHLDGIDAVVNSVGIIRESPGQSFEALHHRAPAELFRACAEAGVACVVQVSALGADADAVSRYHLSKRAADDVLRSLPLRGAVVQPSLVFAPQGASSGLFLALATSPLLLFPQRGGMQVQPVHLDDVVAGIVAMLERPPQRIETVAFVGPQPTTMREYVSGLRRQLGLGSSQWMGPMPSGVFLAAAGVAGHVPGSVLDAETAGMLLRGSAAPADAFRQVLGRAPRDAGSFIPPALATALRHQAVLGWALPALRVSLALLWLWTAVVAFAQPPGQPAVGALALLLGVLTVWAPGGWRPLVWLAQLVVVALSTLWITVVLPAQWLDPSGPVIKNLPIMAVIVLLWALEPRRR